MTSDNARDSPGLLEEVVQHARFRIPPVNVLAEVLTVLLSPANSLRGPGTPPRLHLQAGREHRHSAASALVSSEFFPAVDRRGKEFFINSTRCKRYG